jgi:hypothetical protein
MSGDTEATIVGMLQGGGISSTQLLYTSNLLVFKKDRLP